MSGQTELHQLRRNAMQPMFWCILSPTYVILSRIWGSNPLCSLWNGDVYWRLNGILVFIKALNLEKCCHCSANRMCWSYQWFAMYSLKPMVLRSHNRCVWTLNSFVLSNFPRGWEFLVWAPNTDIPRVSWFWSLLQMLKQCLQRSRCCVAVYTFSFSWLNYLFHWQ